MTPEGMDPSTLRLIGAAVTPAVMVSGCGILATGLDNQIARMTHRMREMLKELRALPHGHSRRRVLKAEVEILDARHAILARAQMSAYAAMISFVLTSLLYLVQARLPVFGPLPLVTFAIGVCLIGTVAVFALGSLRLGRSAIRLEKEEMAELEARGP